MRSKDPNKYPPGLDRRRVQKIIDHYDNQTEEEALAEDEAFRRRADELRRQKYTEDEIDKILEQEADELCKPGEPKHLRRQVTTLKLPPIWLEKAKVMATLHNFSDYRDWIGQIVKERLRLEESLIRGLKKNAANGNNKKRRSSRRALVAK
ncbi:hypothetical protein L0244_32030 [bacterium]|nr:hypothetical protein [bacterium]